MRILVLSDLHLEFNRCNVPDTDADYIVFAGDIHTCPNKVRDFFSSVRAKTNSKIIYVLGNHEFWGHQFFDVVELYRKEVSKISDCYLLEKEILRDGNVCFIGTTLWTDYNKGLEVVSSLANINDYDNMFIGRENVTPSDIIPIHEASVKFVCDALEEENKRVVISHHGPSYKSVNSKYIRSTFNGAFVSDLSNIINRYQPEYWLHGHTHDACDYNLGDTKVVCNPVGYVGECKTVIIEL
jgi:Icc-related predicted phosphoesterase